jgi:hypothetical protein
MQRRFSISALGSVNLKARCEPNLKQCKQLRKHYLQTEKQKKKMFLAINQIPYPFKEG